MSRNLLKRGYTTVLEENKRIINSNDLVDKRLEELSIRMQELRESEDGFISGLVADTLEMSEPVEGDSGEGPAETAEGEGSPVIKGAASKHAAEAARHLREQAETEANKILEDARKEAEQILADAAAQAQVQREKVLSEAKSQGLKQGMEEAARQNEERQRELAAQGKELEEAYEKQVSELEPMFVEKITGIYEHIFHTDLGSYKEVLSYLIAMTMRRVEESRSFFVHVSKDDYPYVSMEKKNLQAQAPGAVIEIVEDQTLGRAECMIETEGGIFDCGLGTQLSELSRKLRLLSYEG